MSEGGAIIGGIVGFFVGSCILACFAHKGLVESRSGRNYWEAQYLFCEENNSCVCLQILLYLTIFIVAGVFVGAIIGSADDESARRLILRGYIYEDKK
jgi:hypothetical protein